MKSDHRHELKTNELAEWLSHLPEWTKENVTTIIMVCVVIIVGVGIYAWRVYNVNVVRVRDHAEFTALLNQLASTKMQIPQAQGQERDPSFLLLQPAKGLETFAQSTKNDHMAALALIKRAEALRAEVHYGNVEQPYFISQTNEAKSSYTEALQRCPDEPSLAAAAKLGLGLCEEELGNFEQARQIYREIVVNPDFEPTIAVAQAKHRLATMADYQQEIIFGPAPKPTAATQPSTQIQPPEPSQPRDIITPFNIYRPLDLDLNFPTEVNPELPDEGDQKTETEPPVDSPLNPPTSEDSSVQVIPLSNKDVLAVSDEDITQMFEKAGFSHSDFFEPKHIKEVRNGLAESGAVQIKFGNKVQATVAANLNQGNQVYVTSRKRGAFIYNMNNSDTIPKTSDVNTPAK
jgi:hypothetical protein